MEKINYPPDYQQVMPYLIIKDAGAFMKFMEDIFGAKEKMKHMRDEHVIMHAEMTVGESVIMLADSTEQFSPRTGGFFIYVADPDAVYDKAMAAGCASITPPADMPYGRSCGIVDPFGNTWWPTKHLAATDETVGVP